MGINSWKKRSNTVHWIELVILFSIILLTVIPASYLLSFLRFPYPLEYREAASLVDANTIHQGVNPFGLNAYPEDMYIYGLIYPFMISPWMNVIQPSILIPRLIDCIFLLFTVCLFFSFLHQKKVSAIGSAIGSLILLNSLCLVLKINGSRPDIPALFFSLLSIYLISTKGTGFGWLCFSGLCMLFCLLLKDYLIIPSGLLLMHIFLFQSKKMGVVFFGILSGLVVGSAILIRFAFPLYLRDAILHPLYVISNDFGFMVMQVATFIRWYGILCFFFICSILYKVWQRLKSANRKWNVNLASFDKPLLEGIGVDFFDWGFICIMIIMMLSIGQNTGNFHTYFQELPLPFLLLSVLPSIERIIQKPSLQYSALFLCLICLIPLCTGYQTKFDQYSKAYQSLERKMDACHTIYGSPITDLYLMKRNLNPIYDNGLTEYGYTIIMSRNKIVQKILGGNDGQLENKWNVWNHSLEDKVRNHEFDCIVVNSQVKQIGNISIGDFYTPETIIYDVLDWDVVTYNQRVDITIWVPKE